MLKSPVISDGFPSVSIFRRWLRNSTECPFLDLYTLMISKSGDVNLHISFFNIMLMLNHFWFVVGTNSLTIRNAYEVGIITFQLELILFGNADQCLNQVDNVSFQQMVITLNILKCGFNPAQFRDATLTQLLVSLCQGVGL